MRFLLFLAIAAASLLLLAPVPASAAQTHDVQAADGRPLESASWHGRPIRRPHQHRATPAADTVSGLRRGTGYRTPGGSQRVRTIQRRLHQLGYRPGPVDGRLGPRTDAALRWFESKHGIESRVSIADATLTHLRDRATGVSASERRTVAPRPERTLAPAPTPAPATAADDPATRPPVDDRLVSGILVALVLLGAAAFVAGFVQARSRARRPEPVATAPATGQATRPTEPAAMRPTPGHPTGPTEPGAEAPTPARERRNGAVAAGSPRTAHPTRPTEET